MSEVKIKTIQEAFPDYKGDAVFLNCIVENINFFKSKNKMEVLLKSEVSVNAKEVFYFKTYIQDKFNLENVSVLVQEPENNNTSDAETISGRPRAFREKHSYKKI